MRSTLHIYNTAPVLKNSTSREEKFSGLVAPRSRLGLNLGPSPQHACNVNQVLNLDTALVSPQFE
ncbi:hypothetical protein ACHAW6_005584 [Cyclotella cf. meneghiniana]